MFIRADITKCRAKSICKLCGFRSIWDYDDIFITWLSIIL